VPKERKIGKSGNCVNFGPVTIATQCWEAGRLKAAGIQNSTSGHSVLSPHIIIIIIKKRIVYILLNS
jgi:hypothetical protein